MRRRDLGLLLLAVVIAAVCVRLGIWQLQRLGERRAYNATVLAAYRQPVTPLDDLRLDSAAAYRRVTVTGRYDPAHQAVLANRPRRGSPGVHLLTPLLLAGTDTAVLVLRGWVYAPDATRGDFRSWQEDSAHSVAGYVRTFDSTTGDPSLGPGIVRALSYDWHAASVPYPLARYMVVLTDTAGGGPNVPPRLDQPVLGEGNHLSYAFQWFAFAAVAIAGTAVYLLHAVRSRRRSWAETEPT